MRKRHVIAIVIAVFAAVVLVLLYGPAVVEASMVQAKGDGTELRESPAPTGHSVERGKLE